MDKMKRVNTLYRWQESLQTLVELSTFLFGVMFVVVFVLDLRGILETHIDWLYILLFTLAVPYIIFAVKLCVKLILKNNINNILAANINVALENEYGAKVEKVKVVEMETINVYHVWLNKDLPASAKLLFDTCIQSTKEQMETCFSKDIYVCCESIWII